MFTIGGNKSDEELRGQFTATCHYCGVPWLRRYLKKDGAGKLYCPDEGNGRDVVTLQKQNEAGARELPPRRRPPDGSYTKADMELQVTPLRDLDQTTARIVVSVPEDGSVVSAPTALVMLFSKMVHPGAGDIRVYQDSLVELVETIPASATTRDGWRVTATLLGEYEAGDYWVLIDDDAFIDLNQVAFPGIASSKTWRFRVQ